MQFAVCGMQCAVCSVHLIFIERAGPRPANLVCPTGNLQVLGVGIPGIEVGEVRGRRGGGGEG